MDTRELIKALRDILHSKIDYNSLMRTEGDSYGWEDLELYLIEAAANKLEQFQNFIDDMLGDHYVDYLDWYANRCRELEEKIESIGSDDNGNN